ncbi:MAG: hypothetical protein FWC40_05185 [Proteobacteria bacterium]|nr:hypothetical protein [Pseudomonadota bacterium]
MKFRRVAFTCTLCLATAGLMGCSKTPKEEKPQTEVAKQEVIAEDNEVPDAAAAESVPCHQVAQSLWVDNNKLRDALLARKENLTPSDAMRLLTEELTATGCQDDLASLAKSLLLHKNETIRLLGAFYLATNKTAEPEVLAMMALAAENNENALINDACPALGIYATQPSLDMLTKLTRENRGNSCGQTLVGLWKTSVKLEDIPEAEQQIAPLAFDAYLKLLDAKNCSNTFPPESLFDLGQYSNDQLYPWFRKDAFVQALTNLLMARRCHKPARRHAIWQLAAMARADSLPKATITKILCDFYKQDSDKDTDKDDLLVEFTESFYDATGVMYDPDCICDDSSECTDEDSSRIKGKAILKRSLALLNELPEPQAATKAWVKGDTLDAARLGAILLAHGQCDVNDDGWLSCDPGKALAHLCDGGSCSYGEYQKIYKKIENAIDITLEVMRHDHRGARFAALQLLFDVFEIFSLQDNIWNFKEETFNTACGIISRERDHDLREKGLRLFGRLLEENAPENGDGPSKHNHILESFAVDQIYHENHAFRKSIVTFLTRSASYEDEVIAMLLKASKEGQDAVINDNCSSLGSYASDKAIGAVVRLIRAAKDDVSRIDCVKSLPDMWKNPRDYLNVQNWGWDGDEHDRDDGTAEGRELAKKAFSAHVKLLDAKNCTETFPPRGLIPDNVSWEYVREQRDKPKFAAALKGILLAGTCPTQARQDALALLIKLGTPQTELEAWKTSIESKSEDKDKEALVETLNGLLQKAEI